MPTEPAAPGKTEIIRQTAKPAAKPSSHRPYPAIGPIELTPVYARYLFSFALRIAIFIAVLFEYLFRRDRLEAFMMRPLARGVTPLTLLWAFFMLTMFLHLFPGRYQTMGILKQKAERYDPDPGYSELELLRFVRRMNIRAWVTMLLWLSFNAFFGILYLAGVISEPDLLMLTVFYFLCDYICIILFCPFQSAILKNKCCVNCRIYDWGHIMMFTPMLFIRNFFSWSLFFMSIIVMFRWEMVYAMHSERFWEGSNKSLRCENCEDRTCQIKNLIRDEAAGHLRRK